MYTLHVAHIYTYILHTYMSNSILLQNLVYTAIMLPGHTDIAFLHLYTKTQTTATSTSHVIVKYVHQVGLIYLTSVLT